MDTVQIKKSIIVTGFFMLEKRNKFDGALVCVHYMAAMLTIVALVLVRKAMVLAVLALLVDPMQRRTTQPC